MAQVFFTPHLRRFVTALPPRVAGKTISEVLANVCQANPQLRGYLLDDQGGLRAHVVVFVDGAMLADRKGMSDPVGEESEVYVMQALSGGSHNG